MGDYNTLQTPYPGRVRWPGSGFMNKCAPQRCLWTWRAAFRWTKAKRVILDPDHY